MGGVKSSSLDCELLGQLSASGDRAAPAFNLLSCPSCQVVLATRPQGALKARVGVGLVEVETASLENPELHRGGWEESVQGRAGGKVVREGVVGFMDSRLFLGKRVGSRGPSLIHQPWGAGGSGRVPP